MRLPEVFSSTPNIGVEYIANKHFGIGINAGFHISSENNISQGIISDNDFYTLMQGRIYPFPRRGGDGLYIGLYGLYEYDKNIPFDNQIEKISSVTFGGILGYKFIYKSNWIVDLGFGTGFGRRFINTENSDGVIVSNQREKFNFPLLAYLSGGYRF